jgi:hypothetical protein
MSCVLAKCDVGSTGIAAVNHRQRCVRLCLKSPRVYVKHRFSSNEMECGNRRVGENHSVSDF